ncbi:LysR family transcriptional regulator [Streptomyces lydicus]|uniref:LysR family transcriptional regulator n=1 Tax=Streptomyces lydicus TaxID=47763 RepID=UPI0037A1195B
MDLNLLRALDALLQENSVPRAAERLGTSPAAASRTLTLDDEPVRELARAVAPLWYLGTWPGAPATVGCASERAEDGAFVVSSRAYVQGLVWRTSGGHAPGSAAQGFASWTSAPAAGSLPAGLR